MYSPKICQFCGKRQVAIKKYKICRPCYSRWIRTGKTAPSKRGRPVVPHAKWREKIRLEKGDEFIKDLKAVRKNPYLTLNDLGVKYGLTRERIRQIYKKYFSAPYTKALKRKALALKEDISCSKDPRNKVNNYKKGTHIHYAAEIEKLFLETCEHVGLDVSPSCDTSSDLVVNGKKVEVKSARTASQAVKGANTKYFSYNVPEREIKSCDFIAAHQPELNLFYIIPNQWKDKTGHSFHIKSGSFPSMRSKHNNYIQYINRFDLLMNH
jgi:hypothetical protein